MNTRMRCIFASLAVTLFMTGCVSTGNVAMKQQTQRSIDAQIVKGKTTKQEVTNMFGSADSVSFTDSGNEVWTYRHSKSKPMARNFIPYNFFSQGQNTQIKELVILFNVNGLVSNYTFRETANQTKAGIAE